MLSVLRKENVFLEQIQKSVIDYYVNKTYWL
jgi:hypothetical protein